MLDLLDGTVEIAMLELQDGQALLERHASGISDARACELVVVHSILALRIPPRRSAVGFPKAASPCSHEYMPPAPVRDAGIIAA